MKLHYLYSILLSCLVMALLPGVSYSQSQDADAITESKVLAMISSVDRASRKGNVAGMIAPLAKDVKIKLTISTPTSVRAQVITLNKEQYAFHARRAMRRRLAYQLERKNTRVKIYDDGKTAMVTGELYESLTIPQGTLRAVTSEVALLSQRDGKLVVTSIEARTRFY